MQFGRMTTATTTREDTFVARPLAPEDVRVGDYISVLHETLELPTFLWCCEPHVAPLDEMVRIRAHSPLGGVPLKVREICLPFVYVKHPWGAGFPLDVRLCQLARLAGPYGKRVWKRMKRQSQASPSPT